MSEADLDEGRLVGSPSVNAVDVRQIVDILRRRALLIMSVATVVTSLAALMASRAEPAYRSSMQLLVSSSAYQGARRSSFQEGVDTEFTDPNVQVDYTAQLNLMTSSKLIERAVALVQSEYPDLKVSDISSDGGGPLTVEQLEGGAGTNKIPSQVFNVSFSTNDPVKAQKVLQALQRVYLENNLEEQKLRLTNGLAFIDEQLPKVQDEVHRAERNLEDFRRQNNLLDPEARGQSLSDALGAIQQDRWSNQVALQEAQARYAALQQQISQSPKQVVFASRLSQSERYQTLLNEIQKTELELAHERLRFQDTSPSIQRLLEQRQSQLALLQEEIYRIGGDPSDVLGNEGALLQQGQLAEVDLSLIKDLISSQTETVGLIAKEKGLTETEEQIRQELARYPSLLSEYNRLKPEVDLNRKTLEQLLQAQQALGLRIAQGGFNWQVIEEPKPGKSQGLGKKFKLIIGLLVGSALGVVVALSREMLDEQIHSSEDLQKAARLPLLGTAPKLPPAASNLFLNASLLGSPAFVSSPADTAACMPFRSALDLAYQNIRLSKSPMSYRSLVVTSALPDEGKSTLTLGLAASAARMSQRVLVIDADLSFPRLHHMLNLPNHQGLSVLLSDRMETVEDSIQALKPGIDVLTAGPVAEDSVQLLSSQRMKDLIKIFENSYDLILIDTPAVLGSVDASVVGSFCSGIILVGRLNRVSRTALTQTVDLLSRLNIVGVIANESNTTVGGYKFADLSQGMARKREAAMLSR